MATLIENLVNCIQYNTVYLYTYHTDTCTSFLTTHFLPADFVKINITMEDIIGFCKEESEYSYVDSEQAYMSDEMLMQEFREKPSM